MVIVTLDQCLSRLSSEVKNQIMEQHKECNFDEEEDLHTLLSDNNYQKKILSSFMGEKTATFFSLLKKYSMLRPNNHGEEQIPSMEEKIALLLLRQKGIVYKLDEKKHKQSFIIPIEFTETYFELVFQEKKTTSVQQVLSIKKYIYFLIELISTVRTKKSMDSKLMKKEFGSSVNWELLKEFLLTEQLLTKKEDGLYVQEEKCDLFFARSANEIKRKLTRFILWNRLGEPLSCHLLCWSIFTSSNGLSRDKLDKFMIDQKIPPEKLQEALEQLITLDIIIPSNEVIYGTTESSELKPAQQGMEIGILEFLIPVTIDNQAIWIFRSWGEILEWDVMVQFSISISTVTEALKNRENVERLFKTLQSYLPESVVSNWQPTFEDWVEKGSPISIKEQLVFYSLSERLHRNYVVEHWKEWVELTEHGLVIESKCTKQFEKLLSNLSLSVTNSRQEPVPVEEETKEITIISEFPVVSSALPEVERLPKQWFKLTAYEERTKQRIIKQAVVLNLAIQVETIEQEIIKLIPTVITVSNGCHLVKSNEDIHLSMEDIVKIAIIHPLKN